MAQISTDHGHSWNLNPEGRRNDERVHRQARLTTGRHPRRPSTPRVSPVRTGDRREACLFRCLARPAPASGSEVRRVCCLAIALCLRMSLLELFDVHHDRLIGTQKVGENLVARTRDPTRRTTVFEERPETISNRRGETPLQDTRELYLAVADRRHGDRETLSAAVPSGVRARAA